MNYTEGRSAYKYWQCEGNHELEYDKWEEFVQNYK